MLINYRGGLKFIMKIHEHFHREHLRNFSNFELEWNAETLIANEETTKWCITATQIDNGDKSPGLIIIDQGGTDKEILEYFDTLKEFIDPKEYIKFKDSGGSASRLETMKEAYRHARVDLKYDELATKNIVNWALANNGDDPVTEDEWLRLIELV